ncbi:hypothetical protein GS399_09460 [Pedobacter sp. HMF7647]|uniref:Entericidin n=1 Tax=Hufsiella arboris TaxID=2695275 RepID=A0A7K1Y9E0_9SPHI|nr:hypothetical protein [Hufsiella arboris]MXV51195.1 hypothetical protein [Hufsiella arboris]
MKNTLKTGLIAMGIALSIAACNSNKSGGSSDSTVTDTSMSTTDSTGVMGTDTTSSTTLDSTAADTTK